jgi:hypothetical protein
MAEWTVIGPVKATGNLLILDGAGACVATIKFYPAKAEECRAVADLLRRAPNMAAILEHVKTELEADDEGTRFADLLAMLTDELRKVSAWTEKLNASSG